MQYLGLQQEDREVFTLLEREQQRQRECLVMIPSENYVSEAVLEANGTIFTNKYAEGYPGQRYYEGNAVVDDLERLCQKRALEVFGAAGYGVNVQAYSGSPANVAVYEALLSEGDTVLSMELSYGVHLTHGAPVNYSGKHYNFIFYGFNKETEQIDYDQLEQLATEHKPKMIISGFTAYPRAIDFERVHAIAKKVGALSMADISHVAGLVVGDAHPSPFPFTDIVTTTTHKTLRGPRAAIIFSKPEFATRIDKSVFPGLQGGPHEHTIAAMAVSLREAAAPAFIEYTKQVVKNAQILAEVLMREGVRLISSGTDTHLLLLDLRPFGNGRGYLVAKALDAAGIVTNRNTVYDEPGSAYYPSGIRLGTPAITTRGMKEAEIEHIGVWIATIIKEFAPIPLPDGKEERKQALKEVRQSLVTHSVIQNINAQVKNLTKHFPAPGL
jgi:glycine hydroxymethyltransferase